MERTFLTFRCFCMLFTIDGVIMDPAVFAILMFGRLTFISFCFDIKSTNTGRIAEDKVEAVGVSFQVKSSVHHAHVCSPDYTSSMHGTIQPFSGMFRDYLLLTCRSAVYNVTLLVYNSFERILRIKVGRRKHHGGAMVQTIHDCYIDTVSMK